MRLALTVLLVISLSMFADTSAQRIMNDETLTVDQRALYLVYSVMDPEKLPADYTLNVEPARSGTPALHEAQLLEDQLSQATLQEIRDLVNRPVLSGTPETFVSPGGNFRIHYTTSGVDAVTLSYAQELAGYFDDSWQTEVTDLGYYHPPSDNGVGGDNLYDIYIISIGGSTLGYTSSGGEYKPPDSTQNCSASHIAMNTNLGYVHQTTTSSHEFQHAIQMSYDYSAPTWFMENTAVNMEDYVFPDINDWMSFWGEGAVRKPWLSITSGNPYWYGSSVWPRMMGNLYGWDAVRQVWQNCADQPGIAMIDAQDQMFQSYGSSFEDAFMLYGMWRFFTGPFYNAAYNIWDPDLALPPSGPVVLSCHNVTSIPDNGDQGPYPPETYGIAWIRVKLEDYQNGWVQFDFDGRDNFDFNLGVFLYNDSEVSFQWYDVQCPDNQLSVAVPGAGYDYAVFFPAHMTDTSLSGNYDWSVSYETGIEEGESFGGTSLNIQQNPMTSGSAVNFTVAEAGRADLSLMDMSGRRVATLFSGDVVQGEYSVSYQEQLASGTYFMVLRNGSSMETQRVSIVR